MAKPLNPKQVQAQKEGKVPMEFIPPAPLAQVALALKSGADKYGKFNWRAQPILASTYIGSMARHLLLEWAAGKDKDADSGLHPLAHVAAACLIVMDSEKAETLVDDRTQAEIVKQL